MYKEHKPTSQIQTLGVTRRNRGDDSALSLEAKAAETRYLAQFGIKLAWELTDGYNTELRYCLDGLIQVLGKVA
ncbi:MAG: hypothetical protein ACKPKO_63695, partial [Candidatus Fonsibacter sp.]